MSVATKVNIELPIIWCTLLMAPEHGPWFAKPGHGKDPLPFSSELDDGIGGAVVEVARIEKRFFVNRDGDVFHLTGMDSHPRCGGAIVGELSEDGSQISFHRKPRLLRPQEVPYNA